MQHKVIVKFVFVVLIGLGLNACVGTQHSKNSTPDEKKAELNLQMGARYLEMGMLKTAKEKLETAEQFDSNNAEVHNVLGVLYERLKQYSRASDQYQQAIRLDAEDADIQNNYGRFLCDRGENDAGLELLHQAVAMPLNNRKWFAYTNVGRCELRRGQQQQAEINLRQALQEKNNYLPALFEMQKISYRSGEFMSARAFLQRFLANSKHNSETLWYAVQTERALGNKKLADDYREKLFNLFPASKEAEQLKKAADY